MLLSAHVCGADVQTPGGLLPNVGFERVQGALADGWAPYGEGYAVDDTVYRSGARSLRCSNSGPGLKRGASYSLQLNQTRPECVEVTGWSRAQGVDGSPDVDYALYLDVVYRDGDHLWGETSAFSVGSHDWQRRRVLLAPRKPIASVAVHCLFREHRGTVWFDDVSARRVSDRELFDGQAMHAPALRPGQRAGWFVRDCATPWSSPRRASDLAAIGLVASMSRSKAGAAAICIEDRTGRDRAITVYYLERFSDPSPIWWDDVRTLRSAGPLGESTNLVRIGSVGAVCAVSRYPFACVTSRTGGRMLAIPPGPPAVCRLGFHAGAGALWAAFDVALTGRSVRFSRSGHGVARFEVVAASVDPGWGFRDAANRYYRLFPRAFQRRAAAEGIWIPFTNPATVDRAADFGIAYHEGDDSVASDDSLGILSFRYTEPMTYWMAMPRGASRDYETALAQLRLEAQGPATDARTAAARAIMGSGARDATGRLTVLFQNAPWCDGAIWVANASPSMRAPAGLATRAALCYPADHVRKQYGRPRSLANGLDGEYLDSIEGWADVLDYGEEAVRRSGVQPTFEAFSLAPVVPTWFSVWELARWMSDDLHARGRLLMANATPLRFHAFHSILDVMGVETNWLPAGAWRPDGDAEFNLRRTLSYHRPYLLLQNTDFAQFGRSHVERYFQRSMFYGVFPSMFSVDASNNPYWQRPQWFNRDRDPFVRYVPTVRRLSQAGWEPLTYARTNLPEVWCERFGRQMLTVFNSGAEARDVQVQVDVLEFRGGPEAGGLVVRDMVTGDEVGRCGPGHEATFRLRVGSEECRALEITDVPARHGALKGE